MSVFSNKQPKLDSKVRFQTNDFNKRLKGARGYKRNVRAVPESRFLKFIFGLGFWSWITLLVVILILGILGYFVYFSKFFVISKFEVNGGDTEQRQQITSTIDDYLKSKGLFWAPRNNIFVLSNQKLTDVLLAKHPTLRKNFTITKKFPRTLVFNLDFRKQEFVVGTVRGVYAYFDDGAFIRKLSDNSSAFFDDYQSNIKIWVQGEWGDKDKPEIGDENFRKIKLIQDNFFPLSNNSIDFFVIGSPLLQDSQNNGSQDPRILSLHEEMASSDIVAYTKWDGLNNDKIPRGFKVYLDAHSDILENLARVEVVVSKKSVDSQKKLMYIDMRFPDRAFLCDLDQVCSQPAAPKVPVEPGSESTEKLNEIPPSQQPKTRGE